MSPARPASLAQHHITIHHLSDLHYQHRSQADRGGDAAITNDDLLVKYRGYLERLEPDRRPDLIVITGDLTSTGGASDLSTVREIIRNDFPSWAGTLAEHIFVVPGPRDVNWEGKEPPGLKTFHDTFHDFGLPSVEHGVPPYILKDKAPVNFVAYPIDTCYSLEECREEMNEQYHLYGTAFKRFVQEYRGALRNSSGLLGLLGGNRRKALDGLRKRYLQLTESNDLTLLDAGRVHPRDFAEFATWAETLAKGQSTADAEIEPLKILITHHPLVAEPDAQYAVKGSERKGTLFEQLASTAGKAGFHLALHGHIHKPQVLSDLSLLQDEDARHPLRQVGAGSLGDNGTFNEITATYSGERDQRHWRLEIRTINLKAQNPHEATRFVLLNRTEDVAKRAEELERERTRREYFDVRVRSVMRQFSEGVFRAELVVSSDRPASVQLPQSPLQSVESIIREVVFPGFGLRVRLFLKEQVHTRIVPRLNAVYLAPPNSDGSGGSGPVTYPVSLAALSLVLGKTLTYPRALKMLWDERDDEWFRRSRKDRQLVRILEELVEEARGASYPGPAVVEQYEALLAKLTQEKAAPLSGADFYHEAPPSYPEFICVPYPQRSPEGVEPEMPEVAVLVVSVRAPEKINDVREEPLTSDGQQNGVFTPERVAMLETLGELVGTILVSASALGKPKGVWDTRLRV
jgi:DNA repair exonuclease SbcCD nuclease subunit